MFVTIFSIIFLVLFALLPIFLWGYGVNMLSHHEWNRERFSYGMIGGGISVLVLYFLREVLEDALLLRIFALMGILTIVLWFVWVASARGSPYVRVFLRKIAFLHASIFLFLYSVIELGIYFLHDSFSISILPIVGGVSGFLFAASLEESMKHLSSVWLTAKEFRFSRRDLLIFWFFVTLGFVFLENILYLLKAYPSGIGSIFLTGMTRSVFALLSHLFAASICVMMWWRALSYGVFSFQYVLIFLSGFALASLTHVLFNVLVASGGMILVILYSCIAYFTFTQWLVLDE